MCKVTFGFLYVFILYKRVERIQSGYIVTTHTHTCRICVHIYGQSQSPRRCFPWRSWARAPIGPTRRAGRAHIFVFIYIVGLNLLGNVADGDHGREPYRAHLEGWDRYQWICAHLNEREEVSELSDRNGPCKFNGQNPLDLRSNGGVSPSSSSSSSPSKPCPNYVGQGSLYDVQIMSGAIQGVGITREPKSRI